MAEFLKEIIQEISEDVSMDVKNLLSVGFKNLIYPRDPLGKQSKSIQHMPFGFGKLQIKLSSRLFYYSIEKSVQSSSLSSLS